MFRKEPVALEEWSEENVALCASRQDEILDAALQMLAPGGRLIYSRPAPLPLLRTREPCPGCWSATRNWNWLTCPKPPALSLPGRTGISLPLPALKRRCASFPTGSAEKGTLPPSWCGEVRRGIRRSAPVSSARKPGRMPRYSPPGRSSCRQTLTEPISGRLEVAGDTLSLLPETLPDLSGLRVIRAGLTLGQLKKGRFEPDHALAMALRPDAVRQILDLTADDPRALSYLKGEAISGSPELSGDVLVTVNGLPDSRAGARPPRAP